MEDVAVLLIALGVVLAPILLVRVVFRRVPWLRDMPAFNIFDQRFWAGFGVMMLFAVIAEIFGASGTVAGLCGLAVAAAFWWWLRDDDMT